MADETLQQRVNLVLYSTKDPQHLDPFSQTGHSPALTTLLFKVCGRNSEKFEEACRLVQLFIIQALELPRKDPVS